MTREEQFFYANAGFSYDPKTQTQEEGRKQCAAALAQAESAYIAAHRVANVECIWEDDSTGFADYLCDKRAGRLAKGIKKPESIECCRIEINGETVASLCGIWDADADYRRVIRAELSVECLFELQGVCNESI
jgi:hypothetical protein